VLLKCFALLNVGHVQVRNEGKWRPGHEANLAPPRSNLSFFGSKCTLLKEVFVTLLEFFGDTVAICSPGTCALLPPSLRPWSSANTDFKMRYCMANYFCALRNDDTVVVLLKCFAPLNVGHVQTPIL